MRAFGLVSGLVVLAMGACVPSNYEGSGTVGTASVSFAADDCQGDVRGHFNVNDSAAGVVFHGTIVDIEDCAIDECSVCTDGQQLNFTYKYQGADGAGAGCGGTGDTGSIAVTSGPLAGYSASGTITGDVTQTPCD